MAPLISDNLPAIVQLCRKHRVQRLFLIGSALEDAFDLARSDVDFLVEFEPFETRGFGDPDDLLREGLSQLLGRKVDLIQRRLVRNPVVRRSMEQSKVPLYAAA